ncbi:metal-dependent hydrolase [Pseudalgibacter alginicilyticus]|uniref:Metal-dependent hydrolase n=1 Tax=Pseudalgibacter alginicilyticus TaxID=1736674 RepID=A0A0P0D733_9FLAO|nr:cyclase family protein [Pseudalgibacter alginicilyticus]ALJ05956.1 metal-dependent hydrolase [Pseudalgibacter alginicilyticus]
MIATIQYNSRKLQIDLSEPLDISIPIKASKSNVNAWNLNPPKIEPVKYKEWIANVNEGACVNSNNISFNPHAHGTHTECVGHITEKSYSINQNLKRFFFLAEVITVAPETLKGDKVISRKQLQFAIGNKKRDAIIIRTIPNTIEKLTKQYSNTNWPYLLPDAVELLVSKGVKHLLLDTPSIDKEKDECELLGHNAFWNTKGKLRLDSTITEFVFVPNLVEDGEYFLNLQIAPFENDASPSKPILYKIKE